MPAVNQETHLRVGHVYLDVVRRQLFLLNPTARQLRDEGVPMTSTDLKNHEMVTVHDEPVKPGDMPLLRAYREGTPVEAAFLLSRPGGQRWRLSWSAVPFRDAEGSITGVLGCVTCTTPGPDWRTLAELAHDLGTPLHSLGMLCAIMDRLDLGEEHRQAVGAVRAAADRALQIGRQVLDYCRGPAPRKGPAEPSWFALEPLLVSLAQEQAPVAERKELTLRVELAEARGWEIQADRVRFGRLLANLLVNAVRYTNRGQVDFTAAWREEKDRRFLEIGVVDTGAGISEEEKESIFHPFQRGQAGKDSDSGGSGLGLAVVDRLVEELGLTLDVYSQYGHGSAFHLQVPVALLRPEQPAAG